MKKISILGLIASLFVVFALSSCGGDDPKGNEDKKLTHIGANYYVSTTFEEIYTLSYLITFQSANELYYETILERPDTDDDKGIRTKSTYHFNYTYDEVTREVKLTKLLSAFEIVDNKEDEKTDDTEDASNMMKYSKLQFDESLGHLTIKGEDNTLTLDRFGDTIVDDF